jgi:hypothetical protein
MGLPSPGPRKGAEAGQRHGVSCCMLGDAYPFGAQLSFELARKQNKH